MKTHKRLLLLAFSLFIITNSAWSQTADTLVAQGRTALAAHDMATATARFSQAVQTSPNHENANFFYGLTRLLNSAQTTAGQNFLNQLGVTADGRDIYNWTATVPKDVNGDPVAPSGVSASTFANHLRTQILPEMVAAEANLAKVTTTSFRVQLTADETAASAVDIDYPDVQMLRALLKGFKYWIYTVNSWNADVQLTALKSLAVSDSLNAKDLLAAYPQLFTLTTTADQTAARTAFDEFVTFYQNASTAVRARASQDNLLFQYDSEMAGREANFRLTLNELKNSLSTPTALTKAPGVTINLANHFTASSVPRNFLPKFAGNFLIRGTLPDVTFGGVVTGVKRSAVDDFLADVTKSVPNILQTTVTGDSASGMTVSLFSDVAYNEEFHIFTDSSVPFSSPVEITEGNVTGQDANGNRRLETTFITAPGAAAAFFQVRSLDTFIINGYLKDSFGYPVSGALVKIKGSDTDLTFSSLDGYFSIEPQKPTRLPYTLYQLEAVAENLGTLTTHYRFRNGLAELQFPAPENPPTPPANDNFANSILLIGFPIATTGTNTGATREAGEPQHTDLNDPYAGRQSVWWSWTALSTGQVQISTAGSNFDTLLGVYTGSSVSALTLIGANDGFPEDNYQTSKVTFQAVAGTTYRIAVDGWRAANGDISLSIATAP